MELEFEGEVWYWKGPAPHYFVFVPDAASREIKAMEPLVTYGWGMIPVTVTVGATQYTTALWPKDGRYIVPLKLAVRKAEEIEEGDSISVQLVIPDPR
ncbi:MAG: DUF1905 domain-containing protein [Fimbriimonadaceae bacterium]